MNRRPASFDLTTYHQGGEDGGGGENVPHVMTDTNEKERPDHEEDEDADEEEEETADDDDDDDNVVVIVEDTTNVDDQSRGGNDEDDDEDDDSIGTFDFDLNTMVIDKIRNIFDGHNDDNNNALLQQEMINVIMYVCDELMTRWMAYRNNFGDVDPPGTYWMKNDPQTNEFMYRLTTLVPPPGDGGGTTTLLDLIFYIWKNEFENGNNGSSFDLFHMNSSTPTNNMVEVVDIQQNICMIVMFLAWDSVARATTIVKYGGIKFLLDVMETYPFVERIQLACMASLVHLMKNSTKDALLTCGASLIMALNDTSHTNDKDSMDTTEDNENDHDKENNNPNIPIITRLVNNSVRAMTHFTSNKSMYEYACAILLAGSRRGCFTAFSLDYASNARAFQQLAKSWQRYKQEQQAQQEQVREDQQEHQHKKQKTMTTKTFLYETTDNSSKTSDSGGNRYTTTKCTTTTRLPSLRGIQGIQEVQAHVMNFATSTTCPRAATTPKNIFDPIRVELFDALANASVAVYQGLATHHYIDVFVLNGRKDGLGHQQQQGSTSSSTTAGSGEGEGTTTGHRRRSYHQVDEDDDAYGGYDGDDERGNRRGEAATTPPTVNHTLEVARCVLIELVGIEKAADLVKHAREYKWHGAAA